MHIHTQSKYTFKHIVYMYVHAFICLFNCVLPTEAQVHPAGRTPAKRRPLSIKAAFLAPADGCPGLERGPVWSVVMPGSCKVGLA